MNTSKYRQLKRTALALAVSTLIIPASVYSQTLEQAVAHTLDTNPEIHRHAESLMWVKSILMAL